jgi:hypothetical protein
MATFADIKSVRLKIKDPLGYINLIEVSELPATVASQTAYTLTDSGVYQKLSGTTWSTIKLEISDASIGTYIDLYGVDKAVVKCVQEILMSVGKSLGMVQFNSGTESVQYQTLKSVYDFYKAMLDSLKEDISESTGTNTGRFVPVAHATIGGVSEGTFSW